MVQLANWLNETGQNRRAIKRILLYDCLQVPHVLLKQKVIAIVRSNFVVLTLSMSSAVLSRIIHRITLKSGVDDDATTDALRLCRLLLLLSSNFLSLLCNELFCGERI